MSLLELILEQQLILISLGVVVVPLLLALLLWLVGLVRRVLQNRRTAATPVEEEATPAPVTASVEDVFTDDEEDTDDEAEVTDDEEPEEDPKASAMQDILSSVFVDEEADAHYAALMDGLDPAELDDIRALADELSGQMGVRHAAG